MARPDSALPWASAPSPRPHRPRTADRPRAPKKDPNPACQTRTALPRHPQVRRTVSRLTCSDRGFSPKALGKILSRQRSCTNRRSTRFVIRIAQQWGWQACARARWRSRRHPWNCTIRRENRTACRRAASVARDLQSFYRPMMAAIDCPTLSAAFSISRSPRWA